MATNSRFFGLFRSRKMNKKSETQMSGGISIGNEVEYRTISEITGSTLCTEMHEEKPPERRKFKNKDKRKLPKSPFFKGKEKLKTSESFTKLPPFTEGSSSKGKGEAERINMDQIRRDLDSLVIRERGPAELDARGPQVGFDAVSRAVASAAARGVPRIRPPVNLEYSCKSSCIPSPKRYGDWNRRDLDRGYVSHPRSSYGYLGYGHLNSFHLDKDYLNYNYSNNARPTISSENKDYLAKIDSDLEALQYSALATATVQVKSDLVQRLLLEALPNSRQVAQGSRSSGTSGNKPNSNTSRGSGKARAETFPERYGQLKRGRGVGGSEDEGEDSDRDEDERRKKPKSKTTVIKNPLRRLKCPYYQRSPEHYTLGSCRGVGFMDMAKLKDHLKRVHTRPLRCPRCWCDVTSDDACLEHLQNEKICDKLPEPNDPRICPRKLRDLNFNRVPFAHANTVEEKWSILYRILFPEDQYTPSPYEENGISVQLEKLLVLALEEEILKELGDILGDVMEVIRRRLPTIVHDCKTKAFTMSKDQKGAQMASSSMTTTSSSQGDSVFDAPEPSPCPLMAGSSQQHNRSKTPYDTSDTSFRMQLPIFEHNEEHITTSHEHVDNFLNQSFGSPPPLLKQNFYPDVDESLFDPHFESDPFWRSFAELPDEAAGPSNKGDSIYPYLL